LLTLFKDIRHNKLEEYNIIHEIIKDVIISILLLHQTVDKQLYRLNAICSLSSVTARTHVSRIFEIITQLNFNFGDGIVFPGLENRD
jgi:hypothetical protein